MQQFIFKYKIYDFLLKGKLILSQQSIKYKWTKNVSNF